MTFSVSYSTDIRLAKALHPARTALQASVSKFQCLFVLLEGIICAQFFNRIRKLDIHTFTLHNPYQFDRLLSTLWITSTPVISLLFSYFVLVSLHRCSRRSIHRLLVNARTNLKFLSRSSFHLHADSAILFTFPLSPLLPPLHVSDRLALHFGPQ